MSEGRDLEFTIEKLAPQHNVLDFDCGNPRLNHWRERFAWTNQRAGTAQTYVAHRELCSVSKYEAPERIAQGIADHPVGVVVLARLALTRPSKAAVLTKPCCERPLPNCAGGC